MLELRALSLRLREVGLDVGALARSGGGAWCFGSRAAGCARNDSDWDFLVVAPEPPRNHHIRTGNLDLVYVRSADFTNGWQGTELASHVAGFGVRIAAHEALVVGARPILAADRKCSVVRHRARHLDHLWSVLQPGQRSREATRLRRDMQRAWLLAHDTGVPPTAMLDRAWGSASEEERRSIIRLIKPTTRIEEAVCALSGFTEIRFAGVLP